MPVINQGVTTLLGCDVSNVQGIAIDAKGLDFVSAKATQGLTFNDRLFAKNRELAKSHWQPFIAYHFLERGNGAAQARHFVNFVNLSGGFVGIGAGVDVELQNRTTGPSLKDVGDFIAEFNRLVPGKQIILYTGAWYWKGHLGNPTAFANIPLWDSAYIRGSGTPQNLIKGVTPNYFVKYGGWTKHSIRQFSSSGTVNGHHPIDLDEFEGTVHDLAVVLHLNYDPLVVEKPVDPKQPSTHLNVDGVLGSMTISAMEHVLVSHKLLGGVSGFLGQHARRALQAYLHVRVDGVLGPITIAALQKHVGAQITKVWDHQTTRHIQSALNAGRF
jgi:GH25 family lysozyme M1 (1,4-beta-N-acetylmuramidase)